MEMLTLVFQKTADYLLFHEKKKVCEVIERDKERYTATVQILPDRDEVFQLDYDDICEYTGDVRNL